MKRAVLFAVSILIGIGLSRCQQAGNQPGENGTELSAERPDSTTAIYAIKANLIVRKTADSLRKVLLGAIEKEGVPAAVTYCNAEATGLTAIYAQDGVEVRRVASRNRNPHNAPKGIEAIALKTMSGSDVRFLHATDQEGRVFHYFQPIYMKAACLNCHGKAESQVSTATMAVLQELYPEDKAMGFELDALRGMWHVEIPM